MKRHYKRMVKIIEIINAPLTVDIEGETYRFYDVQLSPLWVEYRTDIKKELALERFRGIVGSEPHDKKSEV